MIKLIVSDIDETLIDKNRKVPQRNIDAIKEAKDMGKIVMLATGRGPYELFDIPAQADIIEEDRYAICCNGAVIVDINNNNIVSSNGLSFEYAKKIFEYAFDNKLKFYIYTLDKKYAINLDHNDHHSQRNTESNLIELDTKDIDFLKDEFILKVLFKNPDIDFLHSLEMDIASLCNYDIEIAYSSDMYMEINANGVNKGEALKKVCEHYDIDIKDTLAIGDNYNDVKMLQAAGIGVAVANAHLQVKEVADYITIANHKEGAVAEAIEKFILNKKEL